MNADQPGAGHRYRPAAIERRTIRFGGGADRTLAMEHWYWTALDQIAEHEGMPTDELVRAVDRRRGATVLASALRMFCISYFRRAVTGRGGVEGALDEATSPAVADEDA